MARGAWQFVAAWAAGDADRHAGAGATKAKFFSGVSHINRSNGLGRTLTPGKFHEPPYTFNLPMTVRLYKIHKINTTVFY